MLVWLFVCQFGQFVVPKIIAKITAAKERRRKPLDDPKGTNLPWEQGSPVPEQPKMAPQVVPSPQHEEVIKTLDKQTKVQTEEILRLNKILNEREQQLEQSKRQLESLSTSRTNLGLTIPVTPGIGATGPVLVSPLPKDGSSPMHTSSVVPVSHAPPITPSTLPVKTPGQTPGTQLVLDTLLQPSKVTKTEESPEDLTGETPEDEDDEEEDDDEDEEETDEQTRDKPMTFNNGAIDSNAQLSKIAPIISQITKFKEAANKPRHKLEEKLYDEEEEKPITKSVKRRRSAKSGAMDV